VRKSRRLPLQAQSSQRKEKREKREFHISNENTIDTFPVSVSIGGAREFMYSAVKVKWY
jgi:hypothetical protein